MTHLSAVWSTFPRGPDANFLPPPLTLEGKKKRSHPTICHLQPWESRFPSPPSPHFPPFPSASKVKAPAHQAPGFGFSGWWWTQPGGLGWLYRVVSGGWGAPLKGRQPFQPWAYLGFSLPSPPCLSVFPPTPVCPCDCCPPRAPHPHPVSPGVSPSPSVCLCLRRMSRHAVCWRRWVWHSPRPGAEWRCGDLVQRWGVGGPFPLGGTQLRLLCCLTFFCSELWAQDPQTFPPSTPYLLFPLFPLKVLRS